MLRITSLFVLSLSLSLSLGGTLALAQGVALETPADWNGETIQLPPGFAPTMSIKGTEVIRFAPGMFDAESDTFFSYVFVFSFDEAFEASDESITKEMMLYYQGLAKAVLGADAKDFDLESFKISVKGSDAEQADAASIFLGELEWIEPFTTRQAQKLHFDLKVFGAHGDDKGSWFVCVSPAARDADIWKEMHKVRSSYAEALRK